MTVITATAQTVRMTVTALHYTARATKHRQSACEFRYALSSSPIV